MSFLRRARCLVLALCLLAAAARAAAAPPLPVINLDSKTTACQGLRITAQGPENVVVAWATADPARGICYKQRLNYFWEPVKQLAGPVGESPRDLSLAFDKLGRLNMVWTALAGRSRQVFFARMDGRGASQAGLLSTLAAPGSLPAGDADFPAVSPDSAGGVVVVWQESREMRFSIRAVHLAADGRVEDLGSVSGGSLSGLSPQVIATQPAIQVAWYEITGSGSELRLNEWHPAERRWRPAAAERQTGNFPPNVQVLLGRDDFGGLMACWPEVLGDGRGAIKVGLSTVAAGETPVPTTQVLADPPGQHTRPTLSGRLPGCLTLAWQVLSGGNQAIRLGSLQNGGRLALTVTASQPEQRFAAMPDHVTRGNWTAAVWTDDAHEGGKGGVYFTQINWPNMP